MRTERLLNAATVVVMACTIVATVAVVKQMHGSQPERFGSRSGTSVANWQSYADRGEWRGPEKASVVVVEFADYQCPACARLEATLRQARLAHPADLAVVFRNYPLTRIHPRAMAEANAAECAAAQGQFAQMHDLLFALQDSMQSVTLKDVAARAGVPRSSAFETCFEKTTYQSRIDEDTRAGRSLGIGGTPTLLVNGTIVEGAPDSVALERFVTAALAAHNR